MLSGRQPSRHGRESTAGAPGSVLAQPVPQAAARGKAQGRERPWIHPQPQEAKHGKPGDLSSPSPCLHLSQPADSTTTPTGKQSAAQVPGRAMPLLFLMGWTERRR